MNVLRISFFFLFFFFFLSLQSIVLRNNSHLLCSFFSFFWKTDRYIEKKKKYNQGYNLKTKKNHFQGERTKRKVGKDDRMKNKLYSFFL